MFTNDKHRLKVGHFLAVLVNERDLEANGSGDLGNKAFRDAHKCMEGLISLFNKGELTQYSKKGT